MRESKELYTSREEVEQLLQKTLESSQKSKKKKPSVWRVIRRTFYVLLVAVLLFTLGNI